MPRVCLWPHISISYLDINSLILIKIFSVLSLVQNKTVSKEIDSCGKNATKCIDRILLMGRIFFNSVPWLWPFSLKGKNKCGSCDTN